MKLTRRQFAIDDDSYRLLVPVIGCAKHVNQWRASFEFEDAAIR